LKTLDLGVRGQKSEVGDQRSEIRDQRSGHDLLADGGSD